MCGRDTHPTSGGGISSGVVVIVDSIDSSRSSTEMMVEDGQGGSKYRRSGLED